MRYKVLKQILYIPMFCGFPQISPMINCLAVDGQELIGAQTFIESIVPEHPEIVRLTIQVIPTGQNSSRFIAYNISEKIGEPSDPEDFEAMKTKKTIVLKGGDNLDITAPILDKSGSSIAVTGITLRIN